MFCHQLIRSSLHNFRHYATGPSPLAALRKKTGYSFVNCKKALELHNNDITAVSFPICSIPRDIIAFIDLFHSFDDRQNNGYENKHNRWVGQRQPNWKAA